MGMSFLCADFDRIHCSGPAILAVFLICLAYSTLVFTYGHFMRTMFRSMLRVVRNVNTIINCKMMVVRPRSFPVVAVGSFGIIVRCRSQFAFQFPCFLSIAIYRFRCSPVRGFFASYFHASVRTSPFAVNSSRSAPFVPSLIVKLSCDSFVSRGLNQSFHIDSGYLFVKRLRYRSIDGRIFGVFFCLLHVLLTSSGSRGGVVYVSYVFRSSMVNVRFFTIKVFDPSLFCYFRFGS